ncbi:hypothetical protein [Methylobacterium sp. WSM2598]|uniref:hypothetical protein n=1 Tax=Methylobacterium sp. WSM2598 TaxID=398261 RepID=UPI000380C9B5|nr:hypothetical protein [Methylobacterium sp. WSM2598]
MDEGDRLPKIFLPAEPDPFLRIFLSHAALERVGSEAESDLVVVPSLVRDARTHVHCRVEGVVEGGGKPLVVFAQTDYDVIIDAPGRDAIVYRTGLTRAWRLPHEFILPYVWITHPEGIVEKPPGATPVIGFCGTLRNRGTRRRTLAHLARTPGFTSNYIIRDKFWAQGLPVEQAAAEFAANIEQSDFVVCDRGIGNWTVRMYEVLSRGRIPVMLDTGGLLPQVRAGRFEDTLVVAASRRQLVEAIRAVWRDDDVPARQRRCRALWEANFSMTGFARTLSDNLARIVGDPAYRARVLGLTPADRVRRAARRLAYRDWPGR